jgi:uncharacterized protein YjbJ (UPF0337 family)
MSGTADEMKGRVKEAAGDLTDDERLKKEGQADQTAGKVKKTIEKGKDKLDDIVDDVKEKVHQD